MAAQQRVGADLRLMKKTFNKLSEALIDSLLLVFPANAVLSTLKGEVAKYNLPENRKEMHVPAARYFKTMSIETKLPADDGRANVTVAEMVAKCDERLFGDATGVRVPELEALGMREKWPKLDGPNRGVVWDYLQRMAALAYKVVIATRLAEDPSLAEELDRVLKSRKLPPNATAADWAEIERAVREAVQK